MVYGVGIRCVGDANDPDQTPYHHMYNKCCLIYCLQSVQFNQLIATIISGLVSQYYHQALLTVQLIIKPRSLTVTVMFVVGSAGDMFCADHITTSHHITTTFLLLIIPSLYWLDSSPIVNN